MKFCSRSIIILHLYYTSHYYVCQGSVIIFIPSQKNLTKNRLLAYFSSVVLKSEISQNFNEIVGEIERWVEILDKK